MITIKKKFTTVDHNVECFLALLRAAITDEYPYANQYINKDIDWEHVLNLARINKLDGLIHYACSQNPELNFIRSQYSERWKEQKKINLIAQSYKYAAVKQLQAEAEKENITLVSFKGMILADLYPSFELRYSVDTDLFVYEQDKQKVMNLLQKLGYEKNEEHSKSNVPVFVSKKMNHVVEIHYSLWEDYEGIRIDILNEFSLTDQASLIRHRACNLELLTLGHEQHLIYQMFHIIKHFVTDSIGIRYLIDITLFINTYGNSIDYERFWDSMRKLGYHKFCIYFFRLCVKYFNMNSEILQRVSLVDNHTEQELLLDMIHKGVLYEHKTSPWQILGIMTPYLVGEEKAPVTSTKRKLKVLFPSAKALPEKFRYAKQNRLLLPIAWVHKMLDFILRYKTYNNIYKDWYNPFEKLEVAEYRLKLIKKLEL